MKNIIFATFLMLNSISLLAGNPGKNAMDCVTARTTYNDNSNLKFRNNCNHKVFIAWCGDLKSSNKTCGDGRNNTFYTHFRNLDPHDSYRTELKPNGMYNYAACQGTTDYERKGIVHNTKNKGSFTCKKTGSFATKQISQAIGKWEFVVQQANGKWHSQIVVLRDKGVAFYIYGDRKYYHAKWYQQDNMIKVYVFSNIKQYNKNIPDFTLIMNKNGDKFTGKVMMREAQKSFKAKGVKSIYRI